MTFVLLSVVSCYSSIMMRAEEVAWTFSWTKSSLLITSHLLWRRQCSVYHSVNRVAWLQHHIAFSLSLPISPSSFIWQQLDFRQTMFSLSSAVWVSWSSEFMDCYWLYSQWNTLTLSWLKNFLCLGFSNYHSPCFSSSLKTSVWRTLIAELMQYV